MTELLLSTVRLNRSGRGIGLYSICSSNRFVIEAAMLQAKADCTAVCIESTSNQVNQFGGYSGMTAAEFAQFAKTVAADVRFRPEQIILGGDHLGPHPWQGERAEVAMAKARELVRSCVLAGYTKIHLDTSMRCADDPARFSDEIATLRAATLCEVAEAAHSELPLGSPAPVYVIGTEVPSPGGEHAAGASPMVTRNEDVERTITLAHDAFVARGLQSAWERVIAIVVQPGVEFGDAIVFEYNRHASRHLVSYIERNWNLVFEAHSTDYQMRERLKEMVEDHFAILKVGPWLTFAFREAVFALAEIEKEWLGDKRGVTLSGVRDVLEEAMIQNPGYWQEYYHGDEAYLRYARKYSYSDRCRYYWPQPEVQDALGKLLNNLSRHPIPLTLLSQYLPAQYGAVRQGRITDTPLEIIHDKVREVLGIYANACGLHPSHARAQGVQHHTSEL
jgi:D-tagatose-1,6-bisphosphate aldolase subunit GatZ/KbaZ